MNKLIRYLAKLSLAGVAAAAPLAFISGPAVAAGPASCPAFTAAMIDAAALVSRVGWTTFVPPEAPTDLLDDPVGPAIKCRIETVTVPGYGLGTFEVEVWTDPFAGAKVTGEWIHDSAENDSVVTFVGSFAGKRDTTSRTMLACRSQVLQSFAWNQYCAPYME